MTSHQLAAVPPPAPSHPALWEDREVESGLRNLCYLAYHRSSATVHWPTSGHFREETFSLLASGSRPEVAAEVARLREGGEALAPALLVGKSGLSLEVTSQQIQL